MSTWEEAEGEGSARTELPDLADVALVLWGILVRAFRDPAPAAGDVDPETLAAALEHRRMQMERARENYMAKREEYELAAKRYTESE